MRKLTYIFIALATLISLAVFTACNKEDLTQNIDTTTIKPKHWGFYTGIYKDAHQKWDDVRGEWIKDCDNPNDPNTKCYQFVDSTRIGNPKEWVMKNFELGIIHLKENQYSAILNIKNTDGVFDDVIQTRIYKENFDNELTNLNLGSNYNYKTLVLKKGDYKIKILENSEFDFQVSIDSYLK
jgi:hypothetical protein